MDAVRVTDVTVTRAGHLNERLTDDLLHFFLEGTIFVLLSLLTARFFIHGSTELLLGYWIVLTAVSFLLAGWIKKITNGNL